MINRQAVDKWFNELTREETLSFTGRQTLRDLQEEYSTLRDEHERTVKSYQDAKKLLRKYEIGIE